MLAWILFLWFALNYAFAAQLVYLAARRSGQKPGAALAAAALWPRALVQPIAARI